MGGVTGDEQGDIEHDVRNLKLAVIREGLRGLYILLAWLVVNLIPLLITALVLWIEYLIPGSMSVALSPLQIRFDGVGTPVVNLIIGLVFVEVIRNSIILYSKGQPRIELQLNVTEPETND